MIHMPALSNLILYVVISLTILSRFFGKDRVKIFSGLVVFCIITAWYSCNFKIMNVGFLCILGCLIFLYNKRQNNLFLFLIITVLSLLIYLHFIPGFDNFKIYDGVQVSQDGWPFVLYLNYDKPVLALMLSLVSGVLITRRPVVNKPTLKAAAIGIMAVAVLSYAIGYIRWDPKAPEIFPVWAFNNLVFVCFAEEILFRGFIQRFLYRHMPTVPAIMIASIIFGLYHYTGGVLYVLISTFAGVFYGYAYHKTNRIETSILVHFTLNVLHILFFTYPAVKYC